MREETRRRLDRIMIADRRRIFLALATPMLVLLAGALLMLVAGLLGWNQHDVLSTARFVLGVAVLVVGLAFAAACVIYHVLWLCGWRPKILRSYWFLPGFLADHWSMPGATNQIGSWAGHSGTCADSGSGDNCGDAGTGG